MVRFTIRAEIETGEDEPVNARSGSVLAAEVQGSPTDNFLPEIVCGAAASIPSTDARSKTRKRGNLYSVNIYADFSFIYTDPR